MLCDHASLRTELEDLSLQGLLYASVVSCCSGFFCEQEEATSPKTLSMTLYDWAFECDLLCVSLRAWVDPLSPLKSAQPDPRNYRIVLCVRANVESGKPPLAWGR
jgi:hypothetical protein